MEDIIKQFLYIDNAYSYGEYYNYVRGYGHGWGSGYGYGWGDGDGFGYGSGDGFSDGSGEEAIDAFGYGSGEGCDNGSGLGSDYREGYGCGDGDGIESINGIEIYIIDKMQTAIYSVHGNIAKGAILNNDLTLTDCYIAKYNNYFAHGDTAHKAMIGAIDKSLKNQPIEKRINAVVSRYRDIDIPIEHKELFSLHNMLTGSCLMGRTQFAKEHSLDPENGTMTMREFINLTKDAYGGDIIRHLAEAYDLKLK